MKLSPASVSIASTMMVLTYSTLKTLTHSLTHWFGRALMRSDEVEQPGYDTEQENVAGDEVDRYSSLRENRTFEIWAK